MDLAAWNPASGQCWNRLRAVLRQHYPGLQFLWCREVQDGKRRADGVGRGALHFHVIVWAAEPLSLPHLRRWAISAGFGHSVDLVPIEPGSRRAAYYVAKYVTKAVDARTSVPWVSLRRRLGCEGHAGVDVSAPGAHDAWHDELHPEDGPGRYRSWGQSADYGTTMAALDVDARSYAEGKAAERAAAAWDAALAALADGLGAVEEPHPDVGPPSPT